MSNTIFNIKELQEILKIGRSQAYSLVTSGQIKSFKIGKMWRVSEDALNEYINRSEKQE